MSSGQDQTDAWTPVDALAADLISAVGRDDVAGFGAVYAAALDNPELDAITRQVLAILETVVRAWVVTSGSAPEAIESIHDRVLELYPRCTAIVAVNLVVLEHIARSVVGLSNYLKTLESSYACLYGALLIGTSSTVDDVRIEIDGQLRG
jgi:hypothetical protein